MATPEVKIKLTADSAAAQAALKQVSQTTAAAADNVKVLGAAGQQATKQLTDLGRVSRGQFDLSARLARVAVESTKRSVESLREQREAYDELIEAGRRALEQEEKRLALANSGGGGGAGSIRGETLGKVGQLASLGGIAAGGQAGQAAAILIEGQQALRDLGSVGREAFENLRQLPLATSDLGRAALSAAPGLSSAAVGIGTLAVSAGALIAIGVGVAAFSEQLRVAGENARAATAAYIAERDARREVRDEVLGTIELEQRLTEARQRAADAQADIDRQRQVREQVFATAQSQVTGFDPGDISAKIIFAAAEAAGAFALLDEDAKRAADVLRAANGEIEAYTAALADGTAATNDATRAAEESARETAAAEEALARTREGGIQKLQALNQQERDLIAQFEQAQQQRREDLEISRQRAEIEGGVRQQRAQEDLAAALAEQAAALADRVGNIIDASNNAIAAAQQAALDRQVQAAQQISQLQAQNAAQAAAAQAAFDREELRRLQDFRRAQRRIREDGERAENEAIRSGNVIAFLDARANRIREQQRAREDLTVEQRRRRQDFEQQRQEREAATAQRIAEIQAEAAAFSALQQQKIAIEREAVQGRIAAEQQAFQEQQARDAARRELQAQRDAEDAARREQFAREDEARRVSREQAALTARLAAIDQQRNAEIASINQIGQQAQTARGLELALLDTIITKARTALTTLNQPGALNQSVVNTGSFGSFAGSVGSAVGSVAGAASQLLGLPFAGLFDSGGMVKAGKPQFGLFGGQQNEYVFTQAQMNAMRGRGGGGGGINVTVNIPAVNVGELTTPSEARAIATEIAMTSSKQLINRLTAVFSYVQRGG